MAPSGLEDERPDPRQLLARLRNEQAQTARGKLKIFFGYAAGVGKTYAMLDAAGGRVQSGVDVVVGYVEPHARPETMALLAGLDRLPARETAYRGVTLKEFDLDGLLARKPQLALVDELAHTNAPGSRHAKRWRDVVELLDAGIDVWTTLNVQHLESLNDVVAQITGVVVRETLPDEVFDGADEIELVDLPPDELLQRLRAGKVYVAERAGAAMDRFFRLSNLIALRELALRRTAERVNRQVQAARQGRTNTTIWPTVERLLVCVGPAPTSAKVIRTAKRMAAGLRAEWVAVHVAGAELPEAAQAQLDQNLRLAEELGAETASVSGESVAAAILDYARSRNASKIVIGKTGAPRWYRVWKPSIVDALIAQSGDIDVYVIRAGDDAHSFEGQPTGANARPIEWRRLVGAGIVNAAGLLIALGMGIFGMAQADVTMVMLLTVTVTAARFGRIPALLSALVAGLSFNFLFTPPYYSFRIESSDSVVTFVILLAVALTVSTLASQLHERAEETLRRELRTEALFRLSRRLAGTSGPRLLEAAVDELQELLLGRIAVYLPDSADRLRLAAGNLRAGDPKRFDAAAEWVHAHGRSAGIGTETLAELPSLLLPLKSPEGTLGILAIQPSPDDTLTVDRRRLLETFASQIALALARDRLAAEAQSVLTLAETERLRSTLLASISHDLRTPLAVIAGASSSLLESGEKMDAKTQRSLLTNVVEEAKRLSRLVENLLDMTQIESGAVEVQKEWTPIEDVVGSALGHLESTLGHRRVVTRIPDDLPLVPLDGVLIEQVLINLIDNALKYAPADSTLTIEAEARPGELVIHVRDEGPGFAPEELERAFDKFYRSKAVKGTRGSGLGLTICAAIVRAHGGRIWATNQPGGGACLTFTLPFGTSPPAIVELNEEAGGF